MPSIQLDFIFLQLKSENTDENFQSSSQKVKTPQKQTRQSSTSAFSREVRVPNGKNRSLLKGLLILHPPESVAVQTHLSCLLSQWKRAPLPPFHSLILGISLGPLRFPSYLYLRWLLSRNNFLPVCTYSCHSPLYQDLLYIRVFYWLLPSLFFPWKAAS